MILDVIWGVLRFLLVPLSLLPTVATDPTQFSALLQMFTIANQVVDIPTILLVFVIVFKVLTVMGPTIMALKLYKLIRG